MALFGFIQNFSLPFCFPSSTESVFRVQMKETEKLSVAGPVDLLVSEDGLRLQSISSGMYQPALRASCATLSVRWLF